MDQLLAGDHLQGPGEGEEHLEEGRGKDLWASSSFGWALAAWEAAGVGLEPPSSPWDWIC